MLKRTILTLVCVLFSTVCSIADVKIPIALIELPQPAAEFININFSGQKVEFATKEKDGMAFTYEAHLVNGTKIEFDKKGNWQEIDGKKNALPDKVVPKQIRDYVQANHKDQTITKIEREGSGYEIELSNGTDIKFNKKFKVVKTEK